MLERERRNRILWAITGVLALAAALGGLLAPSLYSRVVPAAVLPGALSQDVVTVGVSVAVVVLAGTARAPRNKHDLPIDLGSIVLAALFLVLGGLHLGLLRIESSPIPGPPAADHDRGAGGRFSVLQGQLGRK